MSKNKHSKSFEITLSAVSCAAAVIFLALGIFNRFILATGYFMASVSLMLPLSKQFYAGDALAYIGTCILAVVLGAVGVGWYLIPFIMFFGLHPLVNALQKRFHINKWIALVVKTIWFDFTLWVMYILVFGSSVGNTSYEIYKVINQYIVAFIFVGGSLVFWIYDYIIFKCQMMVNAFVYRIRK